MSRGLLSRREFLKLSSATLLSILLKNLKMETVQAAEAPMQGRVLATSLIVRNAPAFTGKEGKCD